MSSADREWIPTWRTRDSADLTSATCLEVAEHALDGRRSDSDLFRSDLERTKKRSRSTALRA